MSVRRANEALARVGETSREIAEEILSRVPGAHGPGLQELVKAVAEVMAVREAQLFAMTTGALPDTAKPEELLARDGETTRGRVVCTCRTVSYDNGDLRRATSRDCPAHGRPGPNAPGQGGGFL